MTKRHLGISHVPLAPAVQAGDFVFVSGQMPTGADGAIVQGSIEAQTRQAQANVRAAELIHG